MCTATNCGAGEGAVKVNVVGQKPAQETPGDEAYAEHLELLAKAPAVIRAGQAAFESRLNDNAIDHRRRISHLL